MKVKNCLISGLAIPFIALAVIVIYYLMTADYFVVSSGLFATKNNICVFLGFKELILPLMYSILLHFSLFLVLKGIKIKIDLNCLSKADVYRIWGLYLCAILFGFILLIKSLNFSADLPIALNISIFIKPLFLIGFIASLLSYNIINDVYNIYLEQFNSCCSSQLRVLKIQAKLLKRIAFVLIVLSGWMVVPIMYGLYLYKKAKTILN